MDGSCQINCGQICFRGMRKCCYVRLNYNIVGYYLLLDTVYYDCELYDERCKIKIYFLIFSYYVLVVGIRECEYSDCKGI